MPSGSRAEPALERAERGCSGLVEPAVDRARRESVPAQPELEHCDVPTNRPAASSRCPRSGRPRMPSARRVAAEPTGRLHAVPTLERHERVHSSAAREHHQPARGRIRGHGEAIWSAATRALAASPGERTRGRQWTPRRRRRRSDAWRTPSRFERPVLPGASTAGSIAGHAATIPRLPSPVAQLAEHPAVNRRVVGSSPTRGVTKGPGNRVFLIQSRRRVGQALTWGFVSASTEPIGEQGALQAGQPGSSIRQRSPEADRTTTRP